MLAQLLVVLRRLHDHFVGSDSIHTVIDSFAAALQAALHAQGRKVVWDDPRLPADSVRRGPSIAVREKVRRGVLFVAVAERARRIVSVPWLGSGGEVRG